jgi:hypothetical protein
MMVVAKPKDLEGALVIRVMPYHAALATHLTRLWLKKTATNSEL